MREPLNPYQPPSAAVEGAADAPFAVAPLTSSWKAVTGAASFYFGNLGTIAAITLPVFTPVELLKNYLLHTAQAEESFTAMSRAEMFVEAIFGSLVTAALVLALLQKIETGQAMSPGKALREGLLRFGAVIGARFRVGLLSIIGILLLVVPGVIWMLRYSVSDAAVTLEHGRGSTDALSRSATLVRGRTWKVLGVWLLAMVPVLGMQFIGGMIAGLIDSWPVTGLIDAMNDVVYRFFAVMGLWLYLALGGRDREAPPAP